VKNKGWLAPTTNSLDFLLSLLFPFTVLVEKSLLFCIVCIDVYFVKQDGQESEKIYVSRTGLCRLQRRNFCNPKQSGLFTHLIFSFIIKKTGNKVPATSQRPSIGRSPSCPQQGGYFFMLEMTIIIVNNKLANPIMI
jgi:hypothetical protein